MRLIALQFSDAGAFDVRTRHHSGPPRSAAPDIGFNCVSRHACRCVASAPLSGLASHNLYEGVGVCFSLLSQCPQTTHCRPKKASFPESVSHASISLCVNICMPFPCGPPSHFPYLLTQQSLFRHRIAKPACEHAWYLSKATMRLCGTIARHRSAGAGVMPSRLCPARFRSISTLPARALGKGGQHVFV